MEDTLPITVKIPQDEALALFEWIYCLDMEDEIGPPEMIIKKVLWRLETLIQDQMMHIIGHDDYKRILSDALERLRKDENTPIEW